MKLYATTTSERATKGQGGNEYLEINITDEQGDIIANIVVKPRKFEVSHAEVFVRYNCHLTDLKVNEMANDSNDFWGVNKQKGKSQKGENYMFENVEKTIKRIKDNPIDSRYD